MERPTTREALRAWIKEKLDLSIPDKSVCGERHQSPMDYVWSAFHEERDMVVWAPRGGGKTTLGALVTLLDLWFKPGCTVRILGGSQEQSMRMWEQLEPMLDRIAGNELDGRMCNGRARLKTGSSVAVLTQSQRSVRGHRVQRLRCDEVELFDRKVWNAAQLVSRSRRNADGTKIGASLEALSTLHCSNGLMEKIVDGADEAGRKLVHWCLLDVMEKCDRASCEGCELQRDCGGKAREAEGFMLLDDLRRMIRRVSRETWESEMLCLRPSREDAVFRDFSEMQHVGEQDWWHGDFSHLRRTLAIDFGYREAFVCLWLLSDAIGRTFVLDEMVVKEQTLAANVRQMRSRWNGSFRDVTCDPAGGSVNSQTSHSDIEVLRREGFRVFASRSFIKDGLELIRRALKPGVGAPTLRIHPRCKVLIRCMRGYHYHPDKPGELPHKDGEHDHCVDALRYFYINPAPQAATGRWY